MGIDIKNNFTLWSTIVVVIFSIIVVFSERAGERKDRGIREHKVFVVGTSVKCSKNAKSSLYTLHYVYWYNHEQYAGNIDFNKSRRGDICSDKEFFIELDSLVPYNSHLLLDSPVIQIKKDLPYNEINE